jgi:hypothetical protein
MSVGRADFLFLTEPGGRLISVVHRFNTIPCSCSIFSFDPTVTTGPGVIFWSASKKQLTKTTLMKLAKSPVYQQVTVRNHNTVFKLLDLFESE